jgi:hypothetical protein
MKESTLALLAPLLEALRAKAALEEVRPAQFLLDGHDFLHFHGEDADIVADVRLAKRFVRHPVASPEEQAELLGQIDDCLVALESRGRDRARRARQRRRG